LTDANLIVAAMRRHARVVLLTTVRFIVIGAVIAGLVWVLLTPTLGTELMAWIDDLDLPFVDSFFEDPPGWAVLIAGFVPVLVAGFLAWRLLEGWWASLVKADEETYFGGGRPSLWTAPWYAFGIGTALVAIGAAVLLNAAYGPDLAAGYLIGTLLLALLGLSVLSSGGVTFAGTERAEPTIVALGRVPGRTGIASTVVLLAALVLIALPLLGGMLVSAEAGSVILAVEALLISAVLAIEGVREYRVFTKAFAIRSLLSDSDTGDDRVA
jgi:hypothetical protein